MPRPAFLGAAGLRGWLGAVAMAPLPALAQAACLASPAEAATTAQGAADVFSMMDGPGFVRIGLAARAVHGVGGET